MDQIPQEILSDIIQKEKDTRLKNKTRKNFKYTEILEKFINSLAYYITRFETFEKPEKDQLKRIFIGKIRSFIIKDLNQAYWNNQAQKLIEEGREGDFDELRIETEVDHNTNQSKYIFPDETKASRLMNIQEAQRTSLMSWHDYFVSTDSEDLPIWFKIWAFNSILDLGTYNENEEKYNRRTKTTTAPFLELNSLALRNTFSAIDSYLKKLNGDLQDQKLQQTLATIDFGTIYRYHLKALPAYSENGLNITEGQWVKYEHDTKKDGKEASKLVKTLEGYPHGWCTGNSGTAEYQLKQGDFYVYYSNVQATNKPTVPRVAIRMEGNRIAEIRGISKDQNLDPHITPVVNKKLEEFGEEGKRYTKASNDMQKLTAIFNKNKNKEKLTKEELKFIYEIENEIEGFGYSKDPRVAKIIEERKLQGIFKQDLSYITGIEVGFISISKDESMNGEAKFHYGNLYLSGLTTADGLTLPETVGGHLDLSDLTTAEGLILPKTVWGDLYLSRLTTARGLKLPETVRGSLYLSDLTTAEGLIFPETLGGDLYLSHLTTAEELILPKTVGGTLDLYRLTTARGLILPKTVGGSLDLSGLTTADGLTLPKTLGGGLFLSNLTTADGLTLPETVGGSLYLSGLTTAEGLKLPETVGGDLYLRRLTTARD